jgi:hypothetical protein
MNDQPKITFAEIMLLFMAAVIVDVLSLVPVVGSIASACSAILFWLYLKSKGLPPVGPVVALVVDAIPFVGLFPFAIVSVAIAIVIDRAGQIAKAMNKLGPLGKLIKFTPAGRIASMAGKVAGAGKVTKRAGRVVGRIRPTRSEDQNDTRRAA